MARQDIPNPKQHEKGRGIIESILRWIPGFRGYLEKEYRRESDALARKWMVDRLYQGKRALDAYSRTLVDAGQIDAMNLIDRLRAKMDKVVARIDGAMHGYSGFFDFARVDEDLLDDVYDHDHAMMKEVDDLADEIEKSAYSTDDPAGKMADWMPRLDKIEQHIDGRARLLQGLGTQ